MNKYVINNIRILLPVRLEAAGSQVHSSVHQYINCNVRAPNWRPDRSSQKSRLTRCTIVSTHQLVVAHATCNICRPVSSSFQCTTMESLGIPMNQTLLPAKHLSLSFYAAKNLFLSKERQGGMHCM